MLSPWSWHRSGSTASRAWCAPRLWDPMGASDRERLFTAQDGTLPVGHVAEPAELATAYRYLMQQTYSTGECVIVDGGSALV